MNIIVRKNKNKFEVVEKNDFDSEDKVIRIEDSHELASKFAKKIKKGGGFFGFTPNFMVKKV